MGDEREMGLEEYVEEGHATDVGRKYMGELLQCRRCQFQAGHNRRTCQYITKLSCECALAVGTL